jgi:outer membrane biosynthesis protein TonB
MRVTVKYALWLLPLLPLVQGCSHKTPPPAQPQALAPPIVDAPPPKPSTVSTADLPPPVIGDVKPDTTTAPPPKPPPAKKPVRRPKKPATATAPTQEAANTPPATTTAPSVSAIGQLSSGASGNLRSETEETIASTEKGVNGINRTLSSAETKTAAQIREFLKQAREALTTGDVDGANTLAKKAKVLLAELNQ